ncbi:hypothetical protein BO94DRAFT_567834 [Aspergillus sclerotioniger CBS 115572]|uniref:Heterokaryon incompatibility domain-containing protein n=1 Tax=Aspergillus sclerotioniger CBS 115572 TaxID=1450535 RepID=A0A317W2M3_9EURO|nr:hypothetical protein BO94DRAFT_567834 [Aspergillus sclerotioniger CBS 115572]PWY79522.1 hypothetical protein BO94DRAFT_567834 [Aspergillus sclerotioniger CBS 115572]
MVPSVDPASDRNPDPMCPHRDLRLDSNVFGILEPLGRFLENAPTCLGWVTMAIEKSEEAPLLIVPQVTLQVQQSVDPPTWNSPTRTGASFHFLQRATNPCYESPGRDGEPVDGARYVERLVANSLEVVEDSGSPVAFQRAQQWLSFCEENHEACKPPNPDFFPRRLVNMGSWDGSHEPFLYEPTTPVLLTTTTDNIKSCYEKITITTLPLALQDAIMVCRNLKIPNLWVDSLCIIQDDIVAWLHDASTMYDVYLNSHLTITVMEPNSCKSRFLSKQRFGDPSWQQLFHPSMSDSRNGTPSMDGLIRPGEFKPRSYEDRSSLNQRGWCLQESLLPNRRLCYDGNEMIWECVCRQLCECGHVVPPQVPRDTIPGYIKLGALFKTHVLRGSYPSNGLNFLEWHRARSTWRMKLPPHKVPYQRWRDLVMDYTYRTLSKKHDRLRALSGLARMVWTNLRHEDETSELYLAGLWRKELLFDLCWQVRPLDEVAEPPETGVESPEEAGYHIPSWSWASVERPVTYKFALPLEGWKYKPSLVDECVVENVSCQNEIPEGPTSAVIEGSIVLNGSFAPVKLIRGEKELDKFRRKTGFPTSGEMGAFHEEEVELDRPELDRPNGHYYCFRLFSWLTRRMGSQTWFRVLAASTHQTGAFERIGIWHLHVHPEEDTYFARVSCPIFKDAKSASVRII